jgi:hypothetical protein
MALCSTIATFLVNALFAFAKCSTDEARRYSRPLRSTVSLFDPFKRTGSGPC